jgi:hypothetical protein
MIWNKLRLQKRFTVHVPCLVSVFDRRNTHMAKKIISKLWKFEEGLLGPNVRK